MFHKGARSSGGDLDPETLIKVDKILDEFCERASLRAASLGIRRAIVRSQLSCSIYIIIDSNSIFVVAQKQLGMPTTVSFDRRSNLYTPLAVLEAAKWEFGFDDPFLIVIPIATLTTSTEERLPVLEAIAGAFVQSEQSRVEALMNVIQINPIFGPASYQIDPRLAFVLMPFTDPLTEIYRTIIKPTIESPGFNLVCKRADDIKSNRSIIQDIWKSICESRLIIADLTSFNANVMYELGIAHTLGKETLLIYQKNSDIKFPFDLAHIRRIEYENSAVGGRQLESDLRSTLSIILGAGV